LDLSICIVNWNTKSLLRKCLKSIYDETQEIYFEVIVVDNASQDGSVEMLEKDFPQCHTIPSKVNLGFSKGNNLAIKHANGKYILFLNPDTELTTNALSEMQKFLERNTSYGAVGCKLLNKDGSIQFTCARKFPTPLNQFCFLSLLDRLFPRSKLFSSTEMKYWNHSDSKDVDCLSGACIMARKGIIDQLGGFNEDYFMYGEDIDLCYSIKKKLGWSIYYLANEEIYHYSGASSDQVNDRFFSTILQRDSNYKFIRKNYGKSKAAEYRIAVLFGSILRLFIITISLFPLKVKKHSRKMSVYTFKKYLSLMFWSLKIKTIQY